MEISNADAIKAVDQKGLIKDIRTTGLIAVAKGAMEGAFEGQFRLPSFKKDVDHAEISDGKWNPTTKEYTVQKAEYPNVKTIYKLVEMPQLQGATVVDTKHFKDDKQVVFDDKIKSWRDVTDKDKIKSAVETFSTTGFVVAERSGYETDGKMFETMIHTLHLNKLKSPLDIIRNRPK